MSEATPTRAVALELMDERRAMREGYVFLDEKCLLLAGAILRELARYGELRHALETAHDGAATALRAAVGRHGFAGLCVYPASEQRDATLAVSGRSVMGVRLQDAQWRPHDAPPPPATAPSPEAEACRRAFIRCRRGGRAGRGREPATSSACRSSIAARCAARARSRTCCCPNSTARSTASRRASRSWNRKTRCRCARGADAPAGGARRQRVRRFARVRFRCDDTARSIAGVRRCRCVNITSGPR